MGHKPRVLRPWCGHHPALRSRSFGHGLVLLVAVAAGCTGSGGGSAAGSAPADFRTALDTHITAIENRDLATFRTTLTREDDLTVIFPGGSRLETTEAVLDFHETWFADPEWVWDAEVETVLEGRDQSMALLRYSYRDRADGEPREAWLSLVFRLEEGEWRLVHDQNTRIDSAE